MAHAFLSPSGAPAWLLCNLKPWLEKDFPDSSSAAADEGTAAHELGAWCLEEKRDAIERLGDMIRVGDDFWEVTREMAEYVQAYVDSIRAIPGELMVEQRLQIGFLTGEEDATGTGDAVIINGDTLHIRDLKYGYGYVAAENNAQLRTYACAAVRQFSTVFDIKNVVMGIHQPRLNSAPEETISVEDLLVWEAEAKETAARILAGPEGLTAVPGEKQCKFCRAKGSCPTLKEKALSVVRLDDFTDIDAKVALLDNAALADIAPQLELIHDWCNGIRAEIERRLMSGQEIEGWKVVQGKKGNRAWANPENVEELAGKLGLGDGIYAKKLISPTQFEKAFSKTSAWGIFQKMVTQPEGRAAVVPTTDKRPAISTSCDFQPLEH